ncbi:MAG: hypothetical protein ABL901_17075 [Hyphomicrobiaceae bacterium]
MLSKSGVRATLSYAALAASIGVIVLAGDSAPSRAADLAALKTAISEAGFRGIYPPTSGEGAGMIYRDVVDDQGKKFRDIVCEYAFREPPKDAAVVVASENYKEEWTGGLKMSFLPEMAGKVDLNAELTGGKLKSYEIVIDQVGTRSIPAGENRLLTDSCRNRIVGADGKLVTAGGPYFAVFKAASSDTLTYKFNFANNFKANMDLVVKKLAKLNANFDYKANGDNQLLITPKKGRFVFGWNAKQLNFLSDLGLSR